MSFIDILNKIDGFVWGLPIIILLVGTGIYLTVGVGFIQFSRIGFWMKNTLGKALKGKGEAGKGEVTPFQALCTALAATIGTGNISGVAGAIAVGGPGAVFWMWISAIFGMVTKYSEVLLSVKYRERNKLGDWVGGPMYYIKNGLGEKWKWLASIFAIFGAFAAFGIGNCTQVDAMTGAASNILQLFIPNINYNVTKFVLGVIVAVIVGYALLGGIKRLGQMLEKIVPFMAVLYVVAGLIVLIFNIGNLPSVLAAIVKGAFNPSAVVGGALGITVKTAMTKGIGRGLFSNEAGLGSAPIAHAATSNEDPVEQGLYGIFEVFADTIVVCTFTALIILCGNTVDGITYGQSADFNLTIQGMASTLPLGIATVVVGLCLILFALSTVLSWSLYGTRCAEFVFGEKSIRIYQIIFCVFIVAGGYMGLDAAWTLASILNGLMAVPNLIALWPLSGMIFKMTKDYFAKVK